MPQQNINEDFRERSPILQTKISKSKDGKWIIFRTIITEIKSVNYIQEILKSSGKRGGEWMEENTM
jgi:hypothetical protein